MAGNNGRKKKGRREKKRQRVPGQFYRGGPRVESRTLLETQGIKRPGEGGSDKGRETTERNKRRIRKKRFGNPTRRRHENQAKEGGGQGNKEKVNEEKKRTSYVCDQDDEKTGSVTNLIKKKTNYQKTKQEKGRVGLRGKWNQKGGRCQREMQLK